MLNTAIVGGDVSTCVAYIRRISRPAAWYLDRFEAAGLRNCGMMCWTGPDLEDRFGAIERPPEER